MSYDTAYSQSEGQKCSELYHLHLDYIQTCKQKAYLH